MNIFGEKVVLRAMEIEDMELLRETLNDPEIEYSVVGWSFPVSKSEQLRWYESTLSDKKNKRFVFETINTAEISSLGFIVLSNLDWKNRTAGIGIKLFKDAPRKQGYATDALQALLKYVFEELQLYRIGINILAANEASIALYTKNGFRKEGTLRSAIYKKGEYHDLHCYGLLKSDYLELFSEKQDKLIHSKVIVQKG
ncbi:MAG: GNAT family N-acetyltransferase [Clostridiaceae bacterium]|nr:GNAT family N-acetyltransferase [Clostridiaceae bacterium]